jgi:hypothetical protein
MDKESIYQSRGERYDNDGVMMTTMNNESIFQSTRERDEND